jgi:hypothetical protein
LRAMVKELLDIRADFPELRSTETDVIWTTKDAVVFARGQELVIAVNRGESDLKMDEGWTLQFAFDDAPESILPAKSARIYTRTGP